MFAGPLLSRLGLASPLSAGSPAPVSQHSGLPLSLSAQQSWDARTATPVLTAAKFESGQQPSRAPVWGRPRASARSSSSTSSSLSVSLGDEDSASNADAGPPSSDQSSGDSDVGHRRPAQGRDAAKTQTRSLPKRTSALSSLQVAPVKPPQKAPAPAPSSKPTQVTQPVRKAAAKGAIIVRPKPEQLESDSSYGDDDELSSRPLSWTTAQLRALAHARLTVPANAQFYWQQVGGLVILRV
jgi:hypothetical protein